MSGGVNRGLGGVGGPAASRSQWFATNDELFISGDLFSTLDGLAPEPTDMELAGDFDHVRWIKHHELLFLEAGTRCKVMHADSFGAAVRWDVVQEPWDSDDEPDPRYTHSRQCWRDWSMWNPDKVQIVGAPVLAQTGSPSHGDSAPANSVQVSPARIQGRAAAAQLLGVQMTCQLFARPAPGSIYFPLDRLGDRFPALQEPDTFVPTVIPSPLARAVLPTQVFCFETRFNPEEEWDRFSASIVAYAQACVRKCFCVSSSTTAPNATSFLTPDLDTILEKVCLVNTSDTMGSMVDPDFGQYFEMFGLGVLFEAASGRLLDPQVSNVLFIVKCVCNFARAMSDALQRQAADHDGADASAITETYDQAQRAAHVMANGSLNTRLDRDAVAAGNGPDCSAKRRVSGASQRAKRRMSGASQGPGRAAPAERAVGRQWRDEQGRSYQWLLHMGYDLQAAAVRERYSAHLPKVLTSPSNTGAVANEAAQSVRQTQRSPSPYKAASPSPEPGYAVPNLLTQSDTLLGETMRSLSPLPVSEDDIVGQPLSMTFDGKLYRGYVSKVAGHGVDTVCECYFDDHTTVEIPMHVVQHKIDRTPLSAPDLPLPPQDDINLTVDTIARVWGSNNMPACIRDIHDGKTRSAAFLVFDHKIIAAHSGNRYCRARGTELVVNHLGAVVVQFMPGSGRGGVSVCSSCHSWSDQMRSQMCVRIGAPPHLHPCRHICAVRSIHQRLTAGTSDNDRNFLDGDIARNARRFSRPRSPADDISREQSPSEDLHSLADDQYSAEDPVTPSQPLSCILPTSETCHFMVTQV